MEALIKKAKEDLAYAEALNKEILNYQEVQFRMETLDVLIRAQDKLRIIEEKYIAGSL